MRDGFLIFHDEGITGKLKSIPNVAKQLINGLTQNDSFHPKAGLGVSECLG